MTSIVLVVVGLAVGAATLLFSVFDGTVLRPLPYPDSEELVVVWGRNPRNGQLRDVVSGPNYLDAQRQASTFEHLAAIKPDDVVLVQDGRPTVVPALTATAGFFDVLEVSAARGRTFRATDATSGREQVAVVTHGAWQRYFGGDAGLVGRRVELGDRFVTIVGILADEFRFLGPADFYLPLHDDVLATFDRTSFDYWVLGRLRSVSDIGAAAAELERIMANLRVEDPRLTGWSLSIEPLHAPVTEAVRPLMFALAAGVAGLLVVAVFNVAGLFLIRAQASRGHAAIERALGAGKLRIGRRFAAECFSVTFVAAALGVVLAYLGLLALPGIVPPLVAIPGSAARIASFHAPFSVRVGVFATVLATLIGALTTLPATVMLLTGSAAPGIRTEGRSKTPTRATRRAHDAIVAAQIAFSTVLLVSGALAVSTVHNLFAVDSGLRPEGVLTMYAGDLDAADNTGRAAYFRGILDRVAAVPGVLEVGVNDYVPLQAEDDFEGITFLDRPPPEQGRGIREEWRRISEGYFAASGIELVAGRVFERADFGERPVVAVVNQSFVRRHFPSGDPVGARILIHAGEYGEATIVGVVRDVRRRGLRELAPPVLYVPYDRRPRSNMAVFVRVRGSADDWIDPVRQAIWSLDPSQPIDRIRTLDGVLADSLGLPRFGRTILTSLAAAALLLAGLGVFGLVAYSVRLRRRELGVRMALGATQRSLQLATVGRGLWLTCPGIGIGVLLSLAASRTIDALVFGVTASDRWLLATVAVILLATVSLASWLPARRIGGIEPTVALRSE